MVCRHVFYYFEEARTVSVKKHKSFCIPVRCVSYDYVIKENTVLITSILGAINDRPHYVHYLLCYQLYCPD
jgi:hypothetical protein